MADLKLLAANVSRDLHQRICEQLGAVEAGIEVEWLEQFPVDAAGSQLGGRDLLLLGTEDEQTSPALVGHLRQHHNDLAILVLVAEPPAGRERALLEAGADGAVAVTQLSATWMRALLGALGRRRHQDDISRDAGASAATPTVREAEAALAGLVTRSTVMRVVLERTRAVAAVDSTVLLTGETGTGKDLVAHAIHDLGVRHRGPFVAVNCAGLTDSLLSSQLFGHRRGAFTGATRDHSGFFETANGGTVFLDEIGDISPAVQTSLLRVLEEREVIRLGTSTPRPIDVRVIVATHRDLQAEIAAGRFRADLFYRIQVARIALPALRDRPADIVPLARHFLRQWQQASGGAVRGLDPRAVEVLLTYPWPGNVRELKSAIEYALIGCRGAAVTVDDLPPEIAQHARQHLGRLEHGDQHQRLLRALELAQGCRAEAARILGISRSTLYRRLRRTPESAER